MWHQVGAGSAEQTCVGADVEAICQQWHDRADLIMFYRRKVSCAIPMVGAGCLLKGGPILGHLSSPFPFLSVAKGPHFIQNGKRACIQTRVEI